MAFSGTAAITSRTAANTSAAIALTGPTTFVISEGTLADGEYVIIWGEDADGNFVDNIYEFNKRTPASQLIETYREVKVEKSATASALAVGYGS